MMVGVAVGRGGDVFVGVREGRGVGVSDGRAVGSGVWDGVDSTSTTSAKIGSIVGVDAAVPSSLSAHPTIRQRQSKRQIRLIIDC